MYYKKYFFIFSFVFFFSSCRTPEIDPYTAFNYKLLEKQVPVKDLGPGTFTIAVIPDIQNYTLYRCQKEYNPKLPLSYREILERQIDFVVENSKVNGGGIEFAVFLGDLVDKRNEHPEEWRYADNAISKLDSVLPFSVVIGNHDYDQWTREKKGDDWEVNGTEFYTKYFGPKSKHFAGKEWYGGATRNGLNSYIFLESAGYKFLILGLEYEPPEETIAWAQSIIDSYPDLPCIVVTHSFLSLAKIKASGNCHFMWLQSHKKGEGNSGAAIYKKLVKPNKNIFLVLCGHDFDGPEGEGMRVDINDAGYKVYSILSNYQGRADTFRTYGIDGPVEENGDGFLRLMTFDFNRKICHVQTYSTEFKTFEIDADSDFFIDLDWGSRFSKTK
ncbi:MAG: metallophosphoesterase [Treponema sp.]|nr:metallophosphoesterase [Treponema sp.]